MLESAHTRGRACCRQDERRVQGDGSLRTGSTVRGGGAGGHWRPRGVHSPSELSSSNCSVIPPWGWGAVSAQWALTKPKKDSIG